MDDLQQFFKDQKALAEMPEGDIAEYETRMRLKARRKKVWKSDEREASLSQKEPEASELFNYLQSSPGNDHRGHNVKSNSSSCQDNDGFNADEVYVPLSSDKNHLGVSTADASRHPPAFCFNSAQGEVTDATNYTSMGENILSSVEHAASSSATGLPKDIRRTLADAEHDDARFILPSSPSDIPRRQRTKVAKNSNNLREKVLKKRKTPGSDGPTTLDTSNITSPSNSPALSSPSPQVSRALRPRPTVESTLKEKRTRKAEKEKEAAERKKEEQTEKKMTPREYAERVQSKFAEYLAKIPTEKLPLRNRSIFYIGGDYSTASQSTRKKMDHLRRKGATVVPTYDPETVTHIVTEGNAAVTLKALGLKSLDEIPMYIPTLTWNWITEGRPESPEFWFAAFPSRIDASSENTPAYLKARRLGKYALFQQSTEPTDGDFSRIEDFTVADHPEAIEPAHASPSKDQDLPESSAGIDPLAEFYDQARKDLEAGKESPCSSDRSDEDEDPTSASGGTKSRWTCDQKPVIGSQNQDIVDKLSELEEINKTKLSGDPREQRWRVFSYGKSIRAIRAHPKRIRNYEDAISIRGVGHKTAEKIVEIIKTGDLERIKNDNTEDVHAIKLFNNIYGVGLATAQKWYANGCRTLDDIRDRKGGIKLSEVQEIGLRYYEDINTRIPRSEVEEIFNMIKSIALGIDPKLSFLLMGSYRRGAETCGDIDILMTRPTDDGRTHLGVLRLLLKKLHLQGIVTEDLAIPDDFNDLHQTYRGLCWKSGKGPRRRIDILAVPYHERGGALIYYTGDDIFNRAIRLKARSMGYSLSQHGLSRRVLRDESGKRMVTPDLVASETEEEIFRILGVPWQEPHERVRHL